MSFTVNGVAISSPEAQAALQIVSQNPHAYGISPSSLQRNGNNINFSTDQILQILNPFESSQNLIDAGDLGVRVTQQDSRLNQSQFINLAQEFRLRFSQFLDQRHIRFDNGLFSNQQNVRSRASWRDSIYRSYEGNLARPPQASQRPLTPCVNPPNNSLLRCLPSTPSLNDSIRR